MKWICSCCNRDLESEEGYRRHLDIHLVSDENIEEDVANLKRLDRLEKIKKSNEAIKKLNSPIFHKERLDKLAKELESLTNKSDGTDE